MLVWGRQTVIVAWGPRRPMWQLARRCCSSGTPAPTSQARQARRLPRLTLYTGTDCQLCDVAKSVLDDVARDVPFELVEYNIRDNSLEGVKQWRRAYQYGETTQAFVCASALIWPTSRHSRAASRRQGCVWQAVVRRGKARLTAA